MNKPTILLSLRICLVSALAVLVCGNRPLPQADNEAREFNSYIHVPFTDRQMSNQIFRAFESAIIETDYDVKYHLMERGPETEERLIDAGLYYEIVNTVPAYLSKSPTADTLDIDAALDSTIPGYPCYGTVEENVAIAEQMAAEYPTLVDWIDIGDSWEKTVGLGGYDINVLVLTNTLQTQDKPKLFLTCAIHAREYTTASLCLEFAEDLVDGYGNDADATWILDHHEVHILLHANPDGRKHAELGLMWRKNTNETYCGAASDDRGADLNRNFDFLWGCCGGSSSAECSSTYRGADAASEPETQAIQAYLRAIFPDQRGEDIDDPAPMDATGIYIDVHSYSELILYSWGHADVAPPNIQEIETLARKLAYWNNYVPEPIISLYPTDGTTIDFCYGELGVASFVFELGTAFFQSCSVYENQIVPENLPSLRYAAKAVRTPYMTPAGPNAEGVTVSAATVPAGTGVTLSAIVDDTQFNHSSEPTQNVAAAEYYIDTPPWGATPTPISMSASDGSFDNGVESVHAVIDTSGLSEGQHLVFLRGQDSDGNWGAISAVFLTIDNSTICTTNDQCDDALYCNGQETCTDGTCTAGLDPCPGESCDEATDACVDCLNDSDCTDGLYCNGVELCEGGACVQGNAINCDDRIPCTMDTCNEASDSCDNLPDDGACDDGSFCNGAETCVASSGCLPGAAPCPGELCDEPSDSCYECDIDFDCDDGVYCNGDELCINGFCQPGVDPCPGSQCDEGNQICIDCVTDDDCNDGLFCNGEELCVNGSCIPGDAVNCDDQISCSTDSCNESTDRCDHTPDDTLCSDELFCNGEETCDIVSGCQSGSDPCPGEHCNEGSDSCFECATDADCDDGIGCTVDQCINQICQHDDSGCGNCANDSDCDDGEFCNGTETCNNGTCEDGIDQGTACEQASLLTPNIHSGNFNTTGEKWFYTTADINGWWASNMTGRSIYVNGQQVSLGETPLPAPINGRRYFRFTAGQYPWAAWGFW